MPNLLPCPFCGGINTQIDFYKYWTGRRNEILSAEVKHWCDEELFASFLKIRGKTEQEAIDKWNSRVGSFA